MEPNVAGSEGTGIEHQEGAPTSDWAGPQSTLLTDIEQMAGGDQGPNLLEQELKGDAIPEQFRGKKVSDVFGMLDNFQKALKASEDARTQAMATMQALAEQRQAPAPAPTQQAAPAPEAELTEQELKALHDQDPFAYQQKRFEMLEKRLARNVESRVAPMAGAATSAAEQSARQRHTEAFQLLGKEIDAFVSQAFPGGKANEMLAHPEAWDRVVKYVQGENIDKIIQHRTTQATQSATAQRQEAERQAATPSFSSPRSAPPANGASRGRISPATMDETQKEIARNLMPELPPQKAYEEYCKHYV